MAHKTPFPLRVLAPHMAGEVRVSVFTSETGDREQGGEVTWPQVSLQVAKPDLSASSDLE